MRLFIYNPNKIIINQLRILMALAFPPFRVNHDHVSKVESKEENKLVRTGFATLKAPKKSLSKEQIQQRLRHKSLEFNNLKCIMKLRAETKDQISEIWNTLPAVDRTLTEDQLREISAIGLYYLLGWVDNEQKSNPKGFYNIQKRVRIKEDGTCLPKFHVFCGLNGKRAWADLCIKLHPKSETTYLNGLSKDFGKGLEVRVMTSTLFLSVLRNTVGDISKGLSKDQMRADRIKFLKGYKCENQNQLNVVARFVARLTSKKDLPPFLLEGFKREISRLEELQPVVPGLISLSHAAVYHSEKSSTHDNETRTSPDVTTFEDEENKSPANAPKDDAVVHVSKGTEKCILITELGVELIVFLAKNPILKDRLHFLPKFMLQGLQTLAGLAKQGIIHGDIKPENAVIVDQQLKFIDLGITRTMHEESKSGGTPSNYSPERFKSGNYETSMTDDVFALGCVFHAMLLNEDSCLQKTQDIFFNAMSVMADRVFQHLMYEEPEMKEGLNNPTYRSFSESIDEVYTEFKGNKFNKSIDFGDLRQSRINYVHLTFDIVPAIKSLIDEYDHIRKIDSKTLQAVRKLQNFLDLMHALIEKMWQDRKNWISNNLSNGREKGVELLWSMVNEMLHPDKEKRPTASDLLKKYESGLMEMDREVNSKEDNKDADNDSATIPEAALTEVTEDNAVNNTEHELTYTSEA